MIAIRSMSEPLDGILLGTKSNPTTVSDSPVTDPGSVVKVGKVFEHLAF